MILRQILIVKILVTLIMMTHDSDKNSNKYKIILIRFCHLHTQLEARDAVLQFCR